MRIDEIDDRRCGQVERLGSSLDLGDRTVVRTILEEAASEIMGADVYRHENGFVKVLLNSDPDLQVRVHVWDDISMVVDENLHSHRHPIQSRVVVGAFDEDRWVEDSRGCPFRRYDFLPGTPGQLELTERGTIRLSPAHIPKHVRKAGQVYELPVGEFHSVRPITVPTITVFVQDLTVQRDAVVTSEGPLKEWRRPGQLEIADRAVVRALILSEVDRMGRGGILGTPVAIEDGLLA